MRIHSYICVYVRVCVCACVRVCTCGGVYKFRDVSFQFYHTRPFEDSADFRVSCIFHETTPLLTIPLTVESLYILSHTSSLEHSADFRVSCISHETTPLLTIALTLESAVYFITHVPLKIALTFKCRAYLMKRHSYRLSPH